jgi:hypothetical protein
MPNRRNEPSRLVSVFLILLSAMPVSLSSTKVNVLGGAIPGFFADQSPETLDFMMKTNYYAALWTAHVCLLPQLD